MSTSQSHSVIHPTSSTSLSIQLEPYDSPERSRTYQNGNGYATGRGGGERDVQRELDLEEDEEGDLGFQRKRSKGKGKGKMRQSELGDGEEENGQDEEEGDQEAEERKIQESVLQNLAKWSKADSKRRASIRKSNQTQFVTPSLPSPPPLPPVPSASTIIRRTSTMIRKNTLTRKGRRSKGNSFEGTGNDNEEDGRVIELRSSTGSGASRLSMSRKGRRKESLVLDQGRDGVVHPDSVFELPSPTFATREEDTPPISPSLPLVSSPTTSNPFSPVTSPSRPTTLRTESRISTSGSRFIEDLEPIPTESSPRSSTSTTRNPFSPPITPTKNPFSDHSRLDSIDQDSTPRPQFHTRPSSSTIQSYQSQSTIGNGKQLEPSIADYKEDGRPMQPLADQSEQPPYFREPIMSPTSVRSLRNRDQEDDDEEEEGEKNEVGLFDWLLCGCFRTRESRTDEGGWEQQGRTNPNE